MPAPPSVHPASIISRIPQWLPRGELDIGREYLRTSSTRVTMNADRAFGTPERRPTPAAAPQLVGSRGQRGRTGDNGERVATPQGAVGSLCPGRKIWIAKRSELPQSPGIGTAGRCFRPIFRNISRVDAHLPDRAQEAFASTSIRSIHRVAFSHSLPQPCECHHPCLPPLIHPNFISIFHGQGQHRTGH